MSKEASSPKTKPFSLYERVIAASGFEGKSGFQVIEQIIEINKMSVCKSKQYLYFRQIQFFYRTIFRTKNGHFGQCVPFQREVPKTQTHCQIEANFVQLPEVLFVLSSYTAKKISKTQSEKSPKSPCALNRQFAIFHRRNALFIRKFQKSQTFPKSQHGRLNIFTLAINKPYKAELDYQKNGGDGEIRTHGGVTPTQPFQDCTLSRSDTSPLIGSF